LQAEPLNAWAKAQPDFALAISGKEHKSQVCFLDHAPMGSQAILIALVLLDERGVSALTGTSKSSSIRGDKGISCNAT